MVLRSSGNSSCSAVVRMTGATKLARVAGGSGSRAPRASTSCCCCGFFNSDASRSDANTRAAAESLRDGERESLAASIGVHAVENTVRLNAARTKAVYMAPSCDAVLDVRPSPPGAVPSS